MDTGLVQKAGTNALGYVTPWKHPDSGVYWFRRAVPADLRALVGKREEKRNPAAQAPRRNSRSRRFLSDIA
jgi:hypothetical protein